MGFQELTLEQEEKGSEQAAEHRWNW